ncbi:MAG TPA: glutamine--tRNA ligase/YqeY domain fusion protein [Caldisericia bacterium]|nr:glutamine--tRNA ligase/YqeY domain fusion protein [Caldisericia bacterium]
MGDIKEKCDENTSLYNNFIHHIIDEDLASGKITQVHTRFPPEPNGYLHIGHAKSICLNFGIAKRYNGKCNLRFDDTNPSKEDTEYVESIMEDIHWLGFDWEDRLFFASDYFSQLYDCALTLIKNGLAYVCDLNAEEIRKYRGTLTEAGIDSPYRNRSIEENIELFEKMKKGSFADGSKVLRAKIDMKSPNLNMRDPVVYRILRAYHHRTKDQWCIYPMYDYAHPLSDSFEGISHSICTLEFEDHRPLYNWFLEHSGVICKPRQIEFARLNITRTVLSKRILRSLVEEGMVDGWNDPRMPTISGLRRRGYTPSSIRDFCEKIGVAKSNSTVEKEMLEHCIREDLNLHAPRIMAVLNPLKLTITNFPENEIEWLEAENNPEDPTAGKRMVPFSRNLIIEKSDFIEDPPKKFFRLSPGKEVRLKYAYIICCNEVIKDSESGEIVEIKCTLDPNTKSSQDTSGKKVKGTLHWLSVAHAKEIEVRMYEDLLSNETPETSNDTENTDSSKNYQNIVNKESMTLLHPCYIEKHFIESDMSRHFQFLRQGYFVKDFLLSNESKIVFNQIVTLKDTWAKLEKTGKTD